MKTKTILKFLIGLSVVSLGCIPFFQIDAQQQKKSLKYLSQKTPIKSTANFCLDSGIPSNEPIRLINNSPFEIALQFIRSVSFAQCRMISSDHNCWVVDYKVDGQLPTPCMVNFKDFDFLNRQTAIVLDDQLITLCPIRIRSSNGPPQA